MERWNYALFGWEAWLTPRYTSPDMCYHVKCGSSETKGVCTNRRNPNIVEHWDTAPIMTPKISPFPLRVTASNLVVL